MFFDRGRDVLPCQYVKQKPFGTSQGDLEVFIPAIMKKWGPDVPKITPEPLDKSIYNNASDCKPTVSSQIQTQNFATAKAPRKPIDAHKYEFPNYTFCDAMEVIPQKEDCLTVRLTTENVDNSW